MKIYEGLQLHDARHREQAQSASRPTRVRYSVSTEGAGETRMPESFVFPTFIIGQPTFSFGLVAVDSVGVGDVPLASAIVLEWDLNERGMFTGALVGFNVQSNNSDIRLSWTLTFEGFGLRTTSPMTDAFNSEPAGRAP